MTVLTLARPELVAMQGYSSARLEAKGGRIFLNANEAPSAPIVDSNCHRYPEPQPMDLRQRIAEVYGVAWPQVLVGRGSDEAIDLLTRAFCRAGRDAVLISPPTFGMYAVCARVQDAAVIELPLGPAFDYPLAAAIDAVRANPAIKLVYLCTPNNPTGNVIELATVRALLDATRGVALVVVDEAYQEFSKGESALSLLSEFEHLVVLRTLSKAHGLAGYRIGLCFAEAEVVALLQKIMAPYPLPSVCIEAAMRALDAPSLTATAARIAEVRNERARIAAELLKLPDVRAVLPSHANFLSVRFDDPATVYRALQAAGILVRQLQRYPGLSDALRISIGTRADNDALLGVLRAGQPVPPALASGVSA